ncbi:hypothetical protein Pla123a_41710 [Posidoniimonas polymericola]|uniref:Polyprenol-phosphate-mannose-dependent alpha-(1-2)-phosphatidylinositol mannoside mannosyltransferase n=1 Tax=Posidoniimonas polymericola TaxID=2528002 RepID=A0A5C5Y070_9BACT|nr:glycosyltransferase family 87 protein [Posidoniimonas polymericola]TWT67615.1 hypothetical protein Pla123a_41710 [Posidoniimonas polymericola]
MSAESSGPKPPASDWAPPQWLRVVVGVMIAAGVCLGAHRAFEGRYISGPYDAAQDGFFDFTHGVYYPCQAFVDGVSAYGRDFIEGYPVDMSVPLYTPSHFLLHAPLVALPLLPASIFYFLLILLMVYAIARLSARAACVPRAWPIIACLIVMTRGGQATMASGYFTLELVLGGLVAIHYAASRPWLAACGVLLAAGKPTYLLPLLILLACRGNWRAALGGGVLTGAVSALAVGWMAFKNGLPAFFRSLTERAELRQSLDDQLPINSFTQIDLISLVSKWMDWNPGYGTSMAVMLVLLVPLGFALRRLRREGDFAGAATPSGAVIALGTVASVFHQSYDALLLTGAIAGLVTGLPRPAWRWFPLWGRWAVAAMLLGPSFNILSTRSFIQRVGLEAPESGFQFVTSINGVLLAAAFVTLTVLVMSRPKTGVGPAAED